MDNDKLFPTDEAKKQALFSFERLKQDADYQLLCKIFDANIEYLTKQLAETPFETLEEQKELRIKRQAYIDVRNTPEMMIKLFSPRIQEPEMEFDPYEQRRAPEEFKG